MKKLESLKKIGIQVLKDEQTLMVTGGECCGTGTSETLWVGWFSDSHNDWSDEGCCDISGGTGGEQIA